MAISYKNRVFLNSISIALVLPLVLMLLIPGCGNKNGERRINEKLTLAGTDKGPMGGYVFKYLARQSLNIEDYNYNNTAFDKWHKAFVDENYHTTNSIFFILAPRLTIFSNEATEMASFVEAGNTLFVASNYVDPFFTEVFGVSIEDDSLFLYSGGQYSKTDTKKQLTDTATFKPYNFSFFYYPLQKHIVTDSSKTFNVLGTNDFDKPDFLRVKYGNGQLVIMTNVQACTNYFLLTAQNKNYALDAFSYLSDNPNTVYWDDFYRRNPSRSAGEKSIFSALLSIPALKYSLFTLLAMAAAWIITNLVRKQRTIAVLQPNVNSSIEFTQTIARLYYNNKDNHNIALKMIAYLQEYLRNKYYINYNGNIENLANILASKTGLPAEKTEALVQNIYTVQHNGVIDDTTLLKLNEQIQEVMNSALVKREPV